MRVSVVGAGYVGLVTGVCLAKLGNMVTMIEIDPSRAERLLRGEAPFFEPGLVDAFQLQTKQGRLRTVVDAAESIRQADLLLVCVGTPLREDGDADLRQVESAMKTIAEHAPDANVVVRSTLPLGSTHLPLRWLGRTREVAGFATNPEFLRQGSAIKDFLEPTRIVIGTPDGVETPTSGLLRQLYESLRAPVILTDFASAEMIKNAANAFLATKLSFINEVADLCEVHGADIKDVVEGIGLDPRIGTSYLRPGIGFGGSCLPKELANLVRLGRRHGLGIPLMTGAAQANDMRATRVVDRLEELLGSVSQCRVALLGLAFKPQTDDVRHSPAIAVAEALIGRGAAVVAHDPAVSAAATGSVPQMARAESPEAAIAGADLVVLATEWPEYKRLPWTTLVHSVNRPVVYDGRNLLDPEPLRDAGWHVIQVGIAAPRPA